MSIQRDLNQGNLRRWMRKVDAFMKQSKLANASVGRDGIEVYDGGWIRILNGGLEVIGSAIVSGVLNVTGETNLSGTNNLSGANHLTGPTDVTGQFDVTGPTMIGGDTQITGSLEIMGSTEVSGTLDVTGNMSTQGTLDVQGVTTLRNDLNVASGGKITAGSVEIDPANGGQINFAGGSLSSSSLGGLWLTHESEVRLIAPTVTISAPTRSGATPLGITDDGVICRMS